MRLELGDYANCLRCFRLVITIFLVAAARPGQGLATSTKPEGATVHAVVVSKNQAPHLVAQHSLLPEVEEFTELVKELQPEEDDPKAQSVKEKIWAMGKDMCKDQPDSPMCKRFFDDEEEEETTEAPTTTVPTTTTITTTTVTTTTTTVPTTTTTTTIPTTTTTPTTSSTTTLPTTITTTTKTTTTITSTTTTTTTTTTTLPPTTTTTTVPPTTIATSTTTEALVAPTSQDLATTTTTMAEMTTLPPIQDKDEVDEKPEKPMKKLPSQGFQGKGVRHEDGQTHTADWQDEYDVPPEAHHAEKEGSEKSGTCRWKFAVLVSMLPAVHSLFAVQ